MKDSQPDLQRRTGTHMNITILHIISAAACMYNAEHQLRMMHRWKDGFEEDKEGTSQQYAHVVTGEEVG